MVVSFRLSLCLVLAAVTTASMAQISARSTYVAKGDDARSMDGKHEMSTLLLIVGSCKCKDGHLHAYGHMELHRRLCFLRYKAIREY
jgi:hypothetical protein